MCIRDRVNTDYITGKELDMLGLVKGSTIQTKNIGKDISQSFKTLVGGELKAYNETVSYTHLDVYKRQALNMHYFCLSVCIC